MSTPTAFEGLEPRLMLDAAADLYGTLAVTARNYPDPAPDPGDIVYMDYVRNPDPAPGLASYTLHLRCDEATYRANGFAGRFDGPMNQVWAGGILETPTLTGANLLTPQQRALDTHLLFENDALFIPPGGEPHEDRDAGTGLGSYLANGPAKDMIFILIGDNAATDVALAQLVIPAGQQVTIAGDAAYKWQAGGETHYGENPVALTVPASDGTFALSYEITNSGDAAAGPFAVEFYLSADDQIPGEDTLLKRLELPALAAGATTTGTLSDLAFPADGTWYAGMVIDADAQVPESVEANNLAVDQISDPSPAISIDDVQVVEPDAGTADAVFTLELTAATRRRVTVTYATADGTATAGGDYTTTTGTVTFSPGQTARTVTVPVLGETDFEPDETFTVELSDAHNAVIADGQGIGTILNDDPPALSIDDVQLAEGDAGTNQLVFTVSLPAAWDQPVTVDYATADGSAIAGADYTAVTGTLNFQPGTTARTVTVEVIADTTPETEENFFVELSNPINAVLADARGQATIVDDDGRAIDFAGKLKARFTDADGDEVTVMLKGPGAGQVALPAAGNADAAEVRLSGTTAKSQLIIKVKHGRTRLGAINADAALGTINAKTTDLAGDLTVAGSLGKLLLGDVDADHRITIGPRAPGDTKTATTIVLGAVADTSLITATPIKALTLARWRDNDGVADVLQAPWLGKLTTKAGRAGPGHFAADLVLDGTASPPKAVLGTVKIAGDLLDVSWSIAGSTGKLTVTGSAVGCVVRSAGDMGPVSLGRSAGSDFLAGIDPDAGRHATAGGDFAVAATIKSFKVKGLKGPEAGRYFFSNSNVSAASIGAVVLLNIEFANGGEAFGLWARNAGTAREIKSVKWADKVTGTKGRWSPKDGQVFAQPDMVIQIIP